MTKLGALPPVLLPRCSMVKGDCDNPARPRDTRSPQRITKHPRRRAISGFRHFTPHGVVKDPTSESVTGHTLCKSEKCPPPHKLFHKRNYVTMSQI